MSWLIQQFNIVIKKFFIGRQTLSIFLICTPQPVFSNPHGHKVAVLFLALHPNVEIPLTIGLSSCVFIYIIQETFPRIALPCFPS